MKNLYILDLENSKYKKCFIIDNRNNKTIGNYKLNNMNEERNKIIHLYLNGLLNVNDLSQFTFNFTNYNTIPPKSGTFPVANKALDIDTLELVDIPRTEKDYEDINKWINELEQLENSTSETINSPEVSFEPPMSGVSEVPTERNENIIELVKEMETDVKNAAKAGSLFETISVITAELTIGEIVAGIIIIIGSGYGIYKAVEYINDKINYNGNNNNNNPVQNENKNANTIVDRPSRSDGIDNNGDNNNKGKKETVCVQELDPDTLEPIGNEQCTTRTRPESNPNPEDGTDETIKTPQVENKKENNNKNRDEYKNWLRRFTRPRFPEPDDYYNVCMSKPMSLYSKKLNKLFLQQFFISKFISKKLFSSFLLDITDYILVNKIMNKI